MNGWQAGYLALMWGICWAIFLQKTAIGQFLALKRTWLTVVIGIGGDLFILYWLIPYESWLTIVMVISLSSVGIIARSLKNELIEAKEVAHGYQTPPSEQ